MTRNDFIKAIKSEGYQYQYNEQPNGQAYHQIFDQNDQLLAMIDANVADIIMIFGEMPQYFLNSTVIHFGKTPIDCRADLSSFEGKLSKREYQVLKQIKIVPNQDTLTVTTEQLHALRHLKKQINQHFQQPNAMQELR